jgi:hypothetical protein
MTSTLHNSVIPTDQWVVVKTNVVHPDNPSVAGDLVRNRFTGVYCIMATGTVSLCPQDWGTATEQRDDDDLP